MPVTQKIPGSIRILSCFLQILIIVFLTIGALNNILKTSIAISNARILGYHESTLLPLAIILLIATVLYALPRYTMLGAVMLTGWYGGAIATHIIHGDDLPTLIMPVIFGILTWLAIGLRHATIRSILFFSNNSK